MGTRAPAAYGMGNKRREKKKGKKWHKTTKKFTEKHNAAVWLVAALDLDNDDDYGRDNHHAQEQAAELRSVPLLVPVSLHTHKKRRATGGMRKGHV